MSQFVRRASCGLDLSTAADVTNALKYASQNRFDFICLPIVHPRFKREFTLKCKERSGAFTRPDLVLRSSDWSTLIVGKISSYIDVDSPNENIRNQSIYALDQELNFASHLDVPAIIITLHSIKCTNLARILFNRITGKSHYQVWIRVPMTDPVTQGSSWRSDLQENEKSEDTWEWWNHFRSLCNSEKKLGLVLEITEDLPSEEELNRWLGEPVKCIMLCTSVFLTNRKGYPILSKAHQAFVKSMANIDVQIILRGNCRHNNISYYQRYLDHLWKEVNYEADILSEFVRGIEDHVQPPVQPIATNLFSQSYDMYEKDLVKYSEYTRALYFALSDLVPVEEKNNIVVSIMIVGAGRGALVTSSLNAALEADRKVKIYAVEKNPHAVLSLQSQHDFWGDKVTVISSDIRELDFSSKVDILLSELLSSFGDNELSPECLDAAQKFLKVGGISIPESYTSYICPVQTSKLHNEAKLSKEKYVCESPHIAFQRNKYYISKCQPLFTFHHPNYCDPVDNARYKTLTFDVKLNSVLHGFSGFFEAVLYKDVELSIMPETYTYGSITWFPIFFPLTKTVQLKAGNEIKLHFWRLFNKTKVWYEWTISEPIPLPIHNSTGRSYKIELQSSSPFV